MNIESFLGGSDNLFKYLFTIGAIMIVISVIYPLQKIQEIELAIVSYNKEASLINKGISELSDDFRSDSNRYIYLKSEMDSLIRLKGREKVIEDKSFVELRKEANDIINNLKKREREISTKNIVLTSEKRKISALKEHADDYRFYYYFLFFLGLLFLVLGFIFWLVLTIAKEGENIVDVFGRVNKYWNRKDKE